MAMGLEFKPRIIGMVCNWCCYGGADLCGVSRFQYPPFIRLIRVMCSGRVDLAHVFRAFSNGIDAVFIGGCHLNDCHYITNGNYDALSMVKLCKKLLEHVGIHTERVRLEWVSAGEGIRFAHIMNEFGPMIQKLGPLGQAEGIDERRWKLKLQAVTRLVPYIRLVQAERLRVPLELRATAEPEKEYDQFFASDEFHRMFQEAILDKLAITETMLLLRERPLSTAELAEELNLDPSEMSRHLNRTSRQGWIRYDERLGCYALCEGENPGTE